MRAALAQAYPAIAGRTLVSKLQQSLGQPFVVDNRTGAAGNIGTAAVGEISAQLESLAWIRLLPQAGVPADVVKQLSGETVRAMRLADVRDLFSRKVIRRAGGTSPD
jgi:hypothetical protein